MSLTKETQNVNVKVSKHFFSHLPVYTKCYLSPEREEEGWKGSQLVTQTNDFLSNNKKVKGPQ